jgi:hypothetical protein
MLNLQIQLTVNGNLVISTLPVLLPGIFTGISGQNSTGGLAQLDLNAAYQIRENEEEMTGKKIIRPCTPACSTLS